MPDVKNTHLRIYCICGQKMKVLTKMYGLPGKCIACRQKIRIPSRDEVPEGATEIYLKDHPEFLRGPRRSSKDAAKELAAQKALDGARRSRKSGEDPTPITELDLAESTPEPEKRGTTLPIDVLEPLRTLCSLQFKLEKQLAVLDDHHHDDKTLFAEVKGRASRVAKLRAELDDHLHQLLMEVAIELTNTQENIAQTRLSARVGEIAFDEFQSKIYRLRSRRERLERRQQNLRGWLATRDPYVAGGFLDISMENIPEEGFKVVLPVDRDETQPLLSAYVASLRDALNRKSRAEQKLEEAEQMAFDDGDEERLQASQLECKIEKRLARAAVRFFLDRLERLKKDYSSDIETVDAHMEAARDRLKVDEMSRKQYDEMERTLLLAKKDLAKARSVTSRALIANTPSDIPGSGGTFLQRLGFAGDRETTPDMWLGWASALALCAGLFLPLVGEASIVRAFLEYQGLSGLAAWAMMTPVAVAIAVAAATRVSKDLARGLSLLCIWTAAVLLTAYGLFQAFNSLDPFAAQFRVGDSWALRPGVWLMGAGLAGIAVSAVSALWSFGNLRPLVLSIVALGLGLAALIPSDVAGTMAPRPAVDITIAERGTGPEQAGSVRISNSGRRAFQLVSQPTNAKSSYLFVVERRVGENSWSEVAVETPMGNGAGTPGVVHSLKSGETYTVPFNLASGEYRVLLLSGASGPEVRERFTIQDTKVAEAMLDTGPEPPSSPEAANPIEVTQETLQPETESPSGGDLLGPSEIQVELKGVMTGPDEQMRFSFVIIMPDGMEDPMMLSLGMNLWGDWDVSEYNPAIGTVTLQRGENLLILRRGEPVDLPI